MVNLATTKEYKSKKAGKNDIGRQGPEYPVSFGVMVLDHKFVAWNCKLNQATSLDFNYVKPCLD